MGSDVYGLPSQETYLDSQNIHLDAAKIGIISETSKFWSSECMENYMFFADFRLKRANFTKELVIL